MATNKKHIAVYLDPLVEQALIAFCEQKGLKSKKGFMYSTGVNAVLAEFFGIADTDLNNLGASLSSKILAAKSNIPTVASSVGAVEAMQARARVLSNALPVAVNNIPTVASGVGAVEAMQARARVLSNALPVAVNNIPTVASSISRVDVSNLGLTIPSNLRTSFPSGIDALVKAVDTGISSIRASNARKLGVSIPSNFCASDASDILPESIDLEVLPGKLQA